MHVESAGGYHAGCDAWPYNDCTAFTATGVNPYSSAFASFFTQSSYPYYQPGSMPVLWGSGGMPGSDSSGVGSSYGGFGGGSVVITTDTLTLSGSIDVSGKSPASGCGYSSICGGGGAGGYIAVRTRLLLPSTGLLKSDGGQGISNGYSGSIPYSSAGG